MLCKIAYVPRSGIYFPTFSPPTLAVLLAFIIRGLKVQKRSLFSERISITTSVPCLPHPLFIGYSEIKKIAKIKWLHFKCVRPSRLFFYPINAITCISLYARSPTKHFRLCWFFHR